MNRLRAARTHASIPAHRRIVATSRWLLLPPAELELHNVADQFVERIIAQRGRERPEAHRDSIEEIHDEGELYFFP